MKVLKTLLCMFTALACLPGLRAEESGTTEGLLTSKGEYFLQVTPEGQESGVKFVPAWKGGLPKDGGGFDKDTLSNIKDVKLGSKVRVDWKQDEFKRIVKVAVLEQPKPPVVHKPEDNGEMHAKAASGVLIGSLLERRPRRLIIKTQSGENENVFFPSVNGEPDQEAIRKYGEMHPGDMLKVEWELIAGRRVITKLHRGGE